MREKPILTICIPTYNRADVFRGSLECVYNQLQDIDLSEVEIYVSDNCSSDNTWEIVDTFIKRGLPIKYNRNQENLLAAGNFLHCINWASGKYIYLLGDDDYLLPGSIKLLLDALRGKEYGLLFLKNEEHENTGLVMEYVDKTEFVKKVSYYYTFISGCVFRKSIVKDIENPIRYKPTHLLQMPFYLESTISFNCNAMLFGKVLQVGVASDSNGGYNFFDVFVHWYLEIMKEYLGDCDSISPGIIAFLKKDIWPFVYRYSVRILVHKDVGIFKYKNGWKILIKYYGHEWYFWRSWIGFVVGYAKRKMKKMLK